MRDEATDVSDARVGTARAYAALVALAVMAGCVPPTFAPPIRAAQFGAPARLTRGLGAVFAAVGTSGARYGSLGVSVPVRAGLRVEASGDATEYSATGSAGIRYTHLAGRLGMDAEFGLGAGAGGALCGNNLDTTRPCEAGQRASATGAAATPLLYPDGLEAWERVAFGGYAGFGFGARPWSWVEVYLRGRLQLSRATHVPTTLWGTALGGVQFKLGPVDLSAALGWSCYFDERDQANGALLEAGITVPFRVSAP